MPKKLEPPIVSVIMSVFNGELYLPDAIESILTQTFNDFELLIVDDCSTDRSGEICASYADRDARITVIRNDHNLGLTRSLNKALKRVRGKYIARMDADDLSHPLRLQKQTIFLEQNPDIGILGSCGHYIGADGEIMEPINKFLTDLEIRWMMLFRNPFIHSSIMFHASLLDSIEFYREEFKFSQDYELFSRLMKITKGANLKDRLIFWRKTPENITSLRRKDQIDFGLQISKNNINQLFGYPFVTDTADLIVFRKLSIGSYSLYKESDIRKFLEIMKKFLDGQRIGFLRKKYLKINTCSKMLMSIFRKGINSDNLSLAVPVISNAPSAIFFALLTLGFEALGSILAIVRKKWKKRYVNEVAGRN